MLAFITLLVVGTGRVAHEQSKSKQQREIVARCALKSNVIVSYAGPFDQPGIEPELQSEWRKLLSRLLGERVESLSLTSDDKSTDISELAALTDLHELVLSMPISDCSPITHLSSLENLHLCRMPADVLTTLVGLRNLKLLSLTDMPSSDLSRLAEFNNLRSLTLACFQSRDLAYDLAPLAKFACLESLTIENMPACDLSPLAKLTNLKTLVVQGNEVTESQLQCLRKALPNCKVQREEMRGVFF